MVVEPTRILSPSTSSRRSTFRPLQHVPFVDPRSCRMIWLPSMTICACSREMPSSNSRMWAFWPRPMMTLSPSTLYISPTLAPASTTRYARSRLPPAGAFGASNKRVCSSAGMQRRYHNQAELSGGLRRSSGESARQLRQARRPRAQRRDGGARVGNQRLEPAARWASVLAVFGVGDVVGMLEGDAVRGTEARQGRKHIRRPAGDATAQLHGCTEQRRGLFAMQRLQ